MLKFSGTLRYKQINKSRPEDQAKKINESEKIEKYLDLAWELKKKQ